MHFHIRSAADSDPECPSGTIGSESKKVDSPQSVRAINRSDYSVTEPTCRGNGKLSWQHSNESPRFRAWAKVGERMPFRYSAVGGPETSRTLQLSVEPGKVARNDDEMTTEWKH